MKRQYWLALVVAAGLATIVLIGLFLPASLYAAGPPWYARGEFNGYGTTDQMYDDGTHGDLVSGDGIYSVVITPSVAGRYEWKVDDGNWTESYPPSNAWLVTNIISQPVLLTFDSNSYIDGWLPVSNTVNALDSLHTWVAVGDWQGWNNANPTTTMSLEDGIYQYTTVLSDVGTYQYKVVVSGTWDAIGPEGTSGGRSINTNNLAFDTTEAQQRVTFFADAATGRIKVEAWQPVVINEIRIDQPSTDYDEYFELAGAPGTVLDGLTYLVIGDGTGGSGVIEAVVDLTGETIPASGYFVAAESSFTLGTADLTTTLNFENSDNVTHLLVSGFSGSSGDDLDTDDDGVLDVTPWTSIADLIALIEEENPPSGTEYHYGPPTVGPDGSFVPAHAFRCSDSWEIGAYDPVGGDDTPGKFNACAFDVAINEIRIDQPSTDNDEYFELAGPAGTALDNLTYLVIGDGTGGSGVIEAVVDLTGETIPASGYFVAAESTFALGTADLTTTLNFENSDNVTHLLVSGFTGASGDDLDMDDDGVLDVMPWTLVVDLIALIEEENPPSGTEYHYGPPTVGPDGSFVPAHAFRCSDSWEIGAYDPVGGDDTPGRFNACAFDVAINEIRIDQPSTDYDEYFELAGPASAPLDGLTYLVIGDGTGGSGVIEAVVDLTGETIPASGYFVAAENTFTLGTADLTTTLNFENGDNVTHLLVSGFTGSSGDDLDTDDDGVLDVTPWTSIVDLIALIEEENPPSGTEYHYGPPTVGPDGSFVPAHAYRCTWGWEIGAYDPAGGDDTPGAANGCATADLGVDKQGPSCVQAGAVLPYTILINNLSTVDATNVVLTDVLPISTTFAFEDSGWGCPSCTPGVTGTLTWAVGTVPSNTVYSFTLAVTVDVSITVGTVLTNEVEVSTDLPSDDPANNTASWQTTVMEAVRIHDVQGAAHLSPYEGQYVCQVPGIVTAVTWNSFYMQDPMPDGDDATSEGILVYVGSAHGLNAGDEVLVSGQVTEYYPGGYGTGNLSTTQLGSPDYTVVSTGNPLPPPTMVGLGGRVPPTEIIDNDSLGDVNTTPNFDPDEDGIDFYESLEGMLVGMTDAVAVGGTNQYGEIAIVSDGQAYGGVYSPRDGIVIRPGDFNPERLIIDDGLYSTEPQVKTGDMFDGPVVGVLDYSFGNFKLLNPVALPSVTSGGLVSETTTLGGQAGQLTIATFNVLNLSPADTTFDGLANQIVNHLGAPDILALQEIQDNSGETNDGTVDASQTYSALITAIQNAGGPVYDWRDIPPVNNEDGGVPGGNIRVGYLFRPDRVTFVDRGAGGPTDATGAVVGATGVELTLSPGRVDPNDPAFVDSRKPLAAEFLFHSQKVFVVNNHMNSKGGDDALFGRVQPPVFGSEVQRIAQADVVSGFVHSILALDPAANVVVLGDLNDFQFSTPISDTLAPDLLTNLVDTLPAGERYSYIYDGNSQVLDHILVSDNLFDNALVGYDAVHVNAEFPASARPSDHDPALAAFRLAAWDLRGSVKGVEPAGAVSAGDLLTYTVVLSNSGNLDVVVSVTDTLPAELLLVSGFEGGGLTWTGVVSAGEEVVLTLVAQADPGLTMPVTVTNLVAIDDGVSAPFDVTSPETPILVPEIYRYYYMPLIFKNY
jgi:uncharacterized repeat protein (TIGR01451 family)